MNDDTKATAELVKALAEAGAKFAAIEKDGRNPHLHNRYATLGNVLEAVLGPLRDHGIIVTQTPVPMESGWAMQTRLLHVGGGELVGLVPLHSGDSKGLNPMQAMGSAISYGRRYGLLSLLCLTAEDDDGHAVAQAQAQAAQPARQQQQRQGPAPQPRRDDRPARSPAEAERDKQEALGKTPKSGKQLFAWLTAIDPQRGLLRAVNEFGKQQGWPARLVEWDGDMTADAVHFAREEMELAAVADKEAN